MARVKLGKVRAGTGPTRTLASLTLYERSGYARTNEVVVCSIPLAETDQIYGTDGLGIFQSGTAIPCQVRALSRWWGEVTDTTRPISSVQVAFTCASLSASAVDSTTYTLRTPGAGNTGIGITVTNNSSSWDINTGAVTVRVRQTTDGSDNPHNLFDVVTTASGKTFMAAGNTSGLYLHGVTTAADFVELASSKDTLAGSIGASLDNLTFTVSYNGGADQTATFTPPSTGYDTVTEVQTKINTLGSTTTFRAQFKDATNNSLRLMCKNPSDTLTVKSGSANELLGFTNNSSAAYRTNGQDADYSSNAFLPGDSTYTTSIEWQGSEVVVVLVKGKFGTSGSEFQGMNDDSAQVMGNLNANGRVKQHDMTYEARYWFYRNSAYVGLDVLWKGGGADAQGNAVSDAAIKHGGIAVALNYSGVNTKLATYDPGDSAGDYAATLTYASGSPYVYQDFAPSGSGYGFVATKSWTGYLGGATHTIDEPWFVVQQSADDRHVVAMCYRTSKEVVPQGFKYDGTKLLIQPWVEERGEITSGFTTRGYHVFPGNRYYRWRGGLLFADGGHTVATVRGQWAKFCRNPVIVHCQDKYETSKLFGEVGPPPNVCVGTDGLFYRCTVANHITTAATKPITGANYADVWTSTSTPGVPWVLGTRFSSFQMPDPDSDALLEEARNRWVKWKYAMIDSTVSSDGQSLDAMYANRNNSQLTCYGWSLFGLQPRQSNCCSNRYDHVMRLTRAWFVTGNPEFYEWADRMADHMAWVCTVHGNTFEVGRSCPYPETGNSNTQIHGHGFSAGGVLSTQSVQYRPYWYVLSGYLPFKTTSQTWVDERAGELNFARVAVYTNATNTRIQTSRDYSWQVDGLMHHYKIFGYTQALTYAVRAWRHALLYSADIAASGRTIQDENGGTDSGGTGFVTNAVGGNNGTVPYSWGTLTYVVYPLDHLTNFLDWSKQAREKGGQSAVVAASDIVNVHRFFRQCMKYLFTGPDELSPNKATQLSHWTSLERPIWRGGYKGGVDGAALADNTTNLMSSMFYFPCGNRAADWDEIIIANSGINPWMSTTLDSVTATTNGTTTVTLSAHPSGTFGSMALCWFYLDEDGPTAAQKISAHTQGATSFTLASAYAGTSGSGKNFTVTLGGWGTARGGGTVQMEHLCNALDAAVYALRWYKENGMIAQYNALKPIVRRGFEHALLYGLVPNGTYGDWSVSFATTVRGSIVGGYSTGDGGERPQGWYNRNAMNRYLAAERDGIL